MIKKCLLCITFLLVTFFSINCVSSQQAPYQITSQPLIAKDGTAIAAEEREMIRALVPFFTAITNKDAKTIKEINPGLRHLSDEQLLANFASVKSYTLQGFENVSYDGEKLRAVVLYSAEFIKPGTIGTNIAPYQSNIGLEREGETWVISEWRQIKGDSNDMKYFIDILSRSDKAEKRYGVKDLSKWDGL
ncbi:hypothetical protein [Pelosinus fermentans]|uniref:Nuclear transport factor 2 family protein n=1 Tax=Pelosinus fermentans JBW45 TaxID=1192197 RepID=I9NY67_9FIRM|nr:hypothetical protein [Pelosinus fermentans]AJQ27951.1 hypothetical protein JBW_02607 [Pelosinus fermentans JBW45]